jgi:hypothetical protein
MRLAFSEHTMQRTYTGNPGDLYPRAEDKSTRHSGYEHDYFGDTLFSFLCMRRGMLACFVHKLCSDKAAYLIRRQMICALDVCAIKLTRVGQSVSAKANFCPFTIITSRLGRSNVFNSRGTALTCVSKDALNVIKLLKKVLIGARIPTCRQGKPLTGGPS